MDGGRPYMLTERDKKLTTSNEVKGSKLSLVYNYIDRGSERFLEPITNFGILILSFQSGLFNLSWGEYLAVMGPIFVMKGLISYKKVKSN